MSSFKQIPVKSVKILKVTGAFLLITTILVAPTGCHFIRSVTKKEQSAKVNKRINKKNQKNFEKARAEQRQKHYEMQAESTKRRMDYNASQAKKWRESNLKYSEPSIFEKVVHWFEDLLDLFDRPKKGLFSSNIRKD